METTGMFNMTGDEAEAEASVSQVLSQAVTPFLMLMGVIGTILTVSALRDCEMMGGPRTYFMALTVADLSSVLFSFTRFWGVSLTDYDIFSSPSVVCKLLPWLESVSLMVSPWLLVTMAIQVYQGLNQKVNPGNNITPWKARLYTGFVFFVCGLVNGHLLMFFDGADEAGSGAEGVTNVSTNVTVGLVRECVPQSGGYDGFYYDVWPWMSLSASLCIPLITSVVLTVMIFRDLVLRSRQDNQAPLLSSFRQVVVSVLVLSLVTVLMSVSLCGLSFIDARKYWTDYPYTIVDQEGGSALLDVWFVVRLVYYGQFCVRWIVTCFCCDFWPSVRTMCKCKKTDS
ncbi:hypothetical protein ACOMHN_002906 [Nucella lapillus]